LPSLHRPPAGGHEALLEQALALACSPAAAQVCTALFEDNARAAARAADARRRAGIAPLSPLDGWPVTVKALFDVAGQVTHAGSALRRNAEPARQDAAAVARLRAAGAVLLAHTNLTEFAFSGVGLNPHFGTPRNPCDAEVARIPGGSSSGAAVSVALGMAVAALGSDTGGSIRIPAALCGLVGFKNTARRTPLAGAFPLSFTLDTACAMARTVADGLAIDAVLAGTPLAVQPRDVASLRLALPQTLVLDELEPAVARAFDAALDRLSAAGVQIVPLPLAGFAEIGQINQPAGLSAIEAWCTHENDMRQRRAAFDPRVAGRIAAGEGVTAADYLRLLQRRQRWIERTTAQLAGFDAYICPTVPLVAPPTAPLLADDAAFVHVNRLLLRNTFTTNFLDGCAFSLPCQAPGELPVGLMLAAPGGHDAALAGVALAVEATLQGQQPAAHPGGSR
jgi:aspartyl-tRNA(Asn)/glutamyl-tRNA(Gln) amidotransferase subunit A